MQGTTVDYKVRKKKWKLVDNLFNLCCNTILLPLFTVDECK